MRNQKEWWESITFSMIFNLVIATVCVWDMASGSSYVINDRFAYFFIIMTVIAIESKVTRLENKNR